MTNLEKIRCNVMSLLDRRFSEDFDITLFANTHTYDHIMVAHDDSDDCKYEFTFLIGEGYELEDARLRELNGSSQQVYVIHTASPRIEEYRKMTTSGPWGNSERTYWGCWPNSGDIEISLNNFEHTLPHDDIYGNVAFEEAVT